MLKIFIDEPFLNSDNENEVTIKFQIKKEDFYVRGKYASDYMPIFGCELDIDSATNLKRWLEMRLPESIKCIHTEV
jgi:hypothetical protein